MTEQKKTGLSGFQKLTLAVICVATAILGLYDIVIALVGTKKATISWMISSVSTKVPFVSFAFGVLMGHFFAQDTNPAV